MDILLLSQKFFDLIAGDSTLLEREPLEKACAMGEFMAYQHDGFALYGHKTRSRIARVVVDRRCTLGF